MKPGSETLTFDAHSDTHLLSSSDVVPRAPSAAPALPGRYEDLGPIAGGSFGEVRRVRDTLLDRVVAMKLLRAEHATAPHLRRRFLVEAQITAGLQHPGIVAVYDRGELADGRLWFFMSRDSDPVDDLRADPGVVVSYADPASDTYVSVSGNAVEVDDMDKKKYFWNKMTEAWFPGGPTDPNVALIAVDIIHANFWDTKESKVVQLAAIAKAVVMGKPPQIGEQGEVRMR